MQCPNCKSFIAEPSKFCPNCGAQLSLSTNCRKCNTPLAPGVNFCPNCGTPRNLIPSPAPVNQKPARQSGVGRTLTRTFSLIFLILSATVVFYCLLSCVVYSTRWYESYGYERCEYKDLLNIFTSSGHYYELIYATGGVSLFVLIASIVVLVIASRKPRVKN